MPSAIPEQMLAAQLLEVKLPLHQQNTVDLQTQFKNPYKIHKVPTPGKDLNEHDMPIKIAVGSLCHTDGMVSDGIMGTKLPCIPSHEGAGTVLKLGSAVNGFQVGDRILCSRCGVCADCTGPERDTQYCSNVGGYNGVTRDGSFAEYEVVDGRECCVLPDNLSLESAAPLACAGITVWGGLVRADIQLP